MGGFGVTSLFCALAPSIELLIAARALQGVFGALLTPAALAVIAATFPPAERGRAIGAWTAWGGIGTVLGPLIGGQLVDTASWRWIFAINIPVVLITLVLVTRVMVAERAAARGREGRRGRRVPVRVRAGRHDLRPDRAAPQRVGEPGGVAAARRRGARCSPASSSGSGGAAIRCCRCRLFKRRNFAIGNIETFSMYAGLGLLFFFLILFLQQVAGYSAIEAGTTTIPVTAIMFLLSTRFGALADRLRAALLHGRGAARRRHRSRCSSCASTPTCTT